MNSILKSSLGPLLALFMQSALATTIPYQIIASYPHDSSLFTQGLELFQGQLYESSGLYGRSKIIARPFPSKPSDSFKGRVLPDNFFAEGITQYRGKLYLLSWQNQKGLIFDPHSFQLLGSFPYQGQGWGLCAHHGAKNKDYLVMSNGSRRLQWLDAKSLKLSHHLDVTENSKPVDKLNELECHGDYIIANQWQKNHLLIISSQSGEVLARVDLSILRLQAGITAAQSQDAVLNGIAYDASDDSWLVTGKFWPKLFRIRFVLPPLPAKTPKH
ncbi:MAG: glutamine cyclotransferase [Zhongshania sp.]|jgi:glutamine cyclotransferase